MEKVKFDNFSKKKLVGHFYHADSSKGVVMAHGLTGDKSSRGKFEKIASALQKDLLNVLAFDFSGCGESDDEKINVTKQTSDLNSAIEYVKSRNIHEIGLFGHSLGSLSCLKCNNPSVKTMVLTGALTGPLKYDWSKFFTLDQLENLKVTGQIVEERVNNIRPKLVYDIELFTDFEAIRQEEIFQNIKNPILIIHGNNEEDFEESQLLHHSKKGMAMLPKNSKLSVIEGARHSFEEHIDNVIKETREWYSKYLI